MKNKKKAQFFINKWTKAFKSSPKSHVSRCFSRTSIVDADFMTTPNMSTEDFKIIAGAFLTKIDDSGVNEVDDLSLGLPALFKTVSKKNIFSSTVRVAPEVADDHLKVTRREVVRLRDQGVKIKNIAQITGLSIGAVKNTLVVYRGEMASNRPQI